MDEQMDQWSRKNRQTVLAEALQLYLVEMDAGLKLANDLNDTVELGYYATRLTVAQTLLEEFRPKQPDTAALELPETKFEERWPELFEPLTGEQRRQAVLGCWRVLNDGWPLPREAVETITATVVADPHDFDRRYGPYQPVVDDEWQVDPDQAEGRVV